MATPENSGNPQSQRSAGSNGLPVWSGWMVAVVLAVTLLVVILSRTSDEGPSTSQAINRKPLPDSILDKRIQLADPTAALHYSNKDEDRFQIDVDIEHFLDGKRFDRYEFDTEFKRKTKNSNDGEQPKSQDDINGRSFKDAVVNHHVTTGVVIHPEGLILTSAGGLAGHHQFDVVSAGGVPYIADLVAINGGADLALLLINSDVRHKSANLANASRDHFSNLSGNDISLAQIAGYPNAQLVPGRNGHDWLNCNVGFSSESGKLRLQNPVGLPLIGAPVFSENQELVGLLGSASFHDEDSPPVVDTVISRKSIAKFLFAQGVEVGSLARSARVDKGELASTVVLLKAKWESESKVEKFGVNMRGNFSKREKTVAGSHGLSSKKIAAEGSLSLQPNGYAETKFLHTQTNIQPPCFLPNLSLAGMEALPRTRSNRWLRVQGVTVRRKTITVTDRGGKKLGYNVSFSRVPTGQLPATRENNPELFEDETDRTKFAFEDLPAIEESWSRVVSESDHEVIIHRTTTVRTVDVSAGENAKLMLKGKVYFSKSLGRPTLGEFAGEFQFGFPGQPDARQEISLNYQYRDQAHVEKQDARRAEIKADQTRRIEDRKAKVQAITVDKFDQFDPNK